VELRSRIRTLLAAWAVAASLLLAATFARVQADEGPAPPEPELAGFMADLQHHTHKLNLSIVAENAELAAFYLHEVEEVAEQVVHLFPQHDGAPVSALVRSLLLPRVGSLRHALDGPRWDQARSGLSDLVAGCNACHAAAGHGFIRVEVTDANPFNQSFAKP
jgi:hypothetical protein